MTPSTPQSVIWSKLRKINGSYNFRNITSLINPDNLVVTKPEYIANLLVDTFARNSSDENYDKNFLDFKNKANLSITNILLSNTTSNPLLNIPFQPNEFKNILSTTNNSSPGPDGISSTFF